VQYAVFRFKYRSRSTLTTLLNIAIPEQPVVPINTVTPWPQFKQSVTKDQLEKLPQDVLIDGLLKMQTKLAEKETDKVGVKEGEDRTAVVGRRRTTEWVERHSRTGDAKDKGRRKRKSGGGRENKTDRNEDGSWGGDLESIKWE
jgi:hypothetical protein